ncbi:MAG: hypothetical protein OJF49_003882 [Ktedonobacterales bacterium]|nr:MAG: hypothetical protein OJF49_003882 [Ktedonobacterales bacterium]
MKRRRAIAAIVMRCIGILAIIFLPFGLFPHGFQDTALDNWSTIAWFEAYIWISVIIIFFELTIGTPVEGHVEHYIGPVVRSIGKVAALLIVVGAIVRGLDALGFHFVQGTLVFVLTFFFLNVTLICVDFFLGRALIQIARDARAHQ